MCLAADDLLREADEDKRGSARSRSVSVFELVGNRLVLCSPDSSLPPSCLVTRLRNDRKGSDPHPCEKVSVVEREKERKEEEEENCDLPLWLIMNSEKTHQI